MCVVCCQPLITCKRLSGLIYCMGSARFSWGKICETSYSQMFLNVQFIFIIRLKDPEGDCRVACMCCLIVVFFCFISFKNISVSTFSPALEVCPQTCSSNTKHPLGKVLILISLVSMLIWIFYSVKWQNISPPKIVQTAEKKNHNNPQVISSVLVRNITNILVGINSKDEIAFSNEIVISSVSGEMCVFLSWFKRDYFSSTIYKWKESKKVLN